MTVMAIVAGVACLTIWLGLALCWHGFWRTDQRLARHAGPLVSLPSVAAVVPARNEQETIATCIRSLAAQHYAGSLEILVVNDSSSDLTFEVANDAVSEVNGRHADVVNAPPLKPGWVGKLWALNHGIAQLSKNPPDYYWLTDADIRHDAHVLGDLVAKAETNGLGLTSLMVRLRCESFWERLLVPAFIFYFMLLYPFRAVNSRNSRIAGAAGGCMLVRAETLAAIGGIATIRDALIDDCALGKAIKSSGAPIWLGLADHSHSLRGYRMLSDFWMMVVRSAFVQLGHSIMLLIACVLGLTLTFVVPVLLVFAAPSGAALAGALAWGLMTALYLPTVRYHGLPPATAVSLPIVTALFGAMTVHSAIRHWKGRGAAWRGRELHT